MRERGRPTGRRRERRAPGRTRRRPEWRPPVPARRRPRRGAGRTGWPGTPRWRGRRGLRAGRGRERRGPGRTGWRGTRRWRRPHRRRGPCGLGRARLRGEGAGGLGGAGVGGEPAGGAGRVGARRADLCRLGGPGIGGRAEPGAGAHSSGASPARLTHRGAGSASDAVGTNPLPGGWAPQGSAVAAPTSTAAAPFQGSGAAGPPGAGAHLGGRRGPLVGRRCGRRRPATVGRDGREDVVGRRRDRRAADGRLGLLGRRTPGVELAAERARGRRAGRCRRGHGGLRRGRRLRRGRPGGLQRPGDRRHRAGRGLRTGARGTVGGRPGGCAGGRRGLEAEVVERRPVAPGREARRPLRGRRVDPPVGIVVLGHARSPSHFGLAPVPPPPHARLARDRRRAGSRQR